MKYLVLISIFLLSFSFSKEVFGIAIKVEGKASILTTGSTIPLLQNDPCYVGDTIQTYKQTKVLVKRDNGDLIVISGNSTLLLENEKKVEQKEGSIFYNIKKLSKSALGNATGGISKISKEKFSDPSIK